MHSTQLLAVVEVPHDDRVRCQGTGCNHPVFRRISRRPGRIRNSCLRFGVFQEAIPWAARCLVTPAYTSTEGRPLSDEERQLLIENTERLIQQLEAEYRAEAARKAALTAITARPAAPTPPVPPPRPVAPVISPAVRLAAEAQAKEKVRSQFGVDPELPGWRGLVLSEMKRILGQNAG